MRRFVYLITILLFLAACTQPTAGTESTPAARSEPSSDPTPAATSADNPANTQAERSPHALEDFPAVPAISEHTRQLLAAGLEQGRDPQIFTKIGDCMTTSENFLVPFSTGEYDLGGYDHLQRVIDHFGDAAIRLYEGKALDPFETFSIAAAEGFNSASVMEPLWANPAYCKPDESPLACEYRVSNALIAIIMFGTNDVYVFDAPEFEGYMRDVLDATLAAGVVPLLVTFPPQPALTAESRAFNEIVTQLAVEYDVPLANLWLLLQDNPNHGIDPDRINHLSEPDDGCMACFDKAHMQAGITEQNLLVLQSLNVLLDAIP